MDFLTKDSGGLLRNQARAVEEAVIKAKGMAKNGGAFENAAYSI